MTGYLDIEAGIEREILIGPDREPARDAAGSDHPGIIKLSCLRCRLKSVELRNCLHRIPSGHHARHDPMKVIGLQRKRHQFVMYRDLEVFREDRKKTDLPASVHDLIIRSAVQTHISRKNRLAFDRDQCVRQFIHRIHAGTVERIRAHPQIDKARILKIPIHRRIDDDLCEHAVCRVLCKCRMEREKE